MTFFCDQLQNKIGNKTLFILSYSYLHKSKKCRYTFLPHHVLIREFQVKEDFVQENSAKTRFQSGKTDFGKGMSGEKKIMFRENQEIPPKLVLTLSTVKKNQENQGKVRKQYRGKWNFNQEKLFNKGFW